MREFLRGFLPIKTQRPQVQRGHYPGMHMIHRRVKAPASGYADEEKALETEAKHQQRDGERPEKAGGLCPALGLTDNQVLLLRTWRQGSAA